MKFGSYMYLSKVTQVCSNQGCMTYFYRNMLMRFWLIMQHVYHMRVIFCIFSNSYIFFSETTNQKSFIYHGLLRFFNQCDDHSAVWHFYFYLQTEHAECAHASSDHRWVIFKSKNIPWGIMFLNMRSFTSITLLLPKSQSAWNTRF